MHKRSFGWIAIKINNKIKYLKVPTYDLAQYPRLTPMLKQGARFAALHDERLIDLLFLTPMSS